MSFRESISVHDWAVSSIIEVSESTINESGLVYKIYKWKSIRVEDILHPWTASCSRCRTTGSHGFPRYSTSGFWCCAWK
jgi:hypothetical protein